MNKLIITIIALFTFLNGFGQTYITSKTAYPVANIINSVYLKNDKRVSYDVADQIIRGIGINFLKKANFSGEFFTYNNMLISCFVLNKNDHMPIEKFINWERSVAASGDERDLSEYYYSEIKNFNGFKAYISYFKNNTNVISIIIYDNTNRYVIKMNIYHLKTENKLAETFINTLLNSITFK